MRDQEQNMRDQEFKDIVMKYAYQHLSPMHIKVLEENYCGPESLFKGNAITGEMKPWIIDEVSDEIVLREIGTIVHESTHMFCSEDERFIVSETEYIDVQKTEVIRTSLIADDMINRNDGCKATRTFNIYINVDFNRNLGSNIGGIYGLMDEYCAFYNGVSAAWTLYKEFKKERESARNDSIFEWYKERQEDVGIDALAHIDAFYEFNSFIAAYLIYVQEYHPNIYNGIMNNTEFLQAYAIVTNNYQPLAEEIQKEFPENKVLDTRLIIKWEEVISVYNDYIPFLEKLRNIANNQLLTRN